MLLSRTQIMPALLLQKPSNSSKSKEHLQTLERRLQQWKKGEFIQLLREAETIQQRIPSGLSKRDLATTSRKFRDLMQKGNINVRPIGVCEVYEESWESHERAKNGCCKIRSEHAIVWTKVSNSCHVINV